jgi:hypothetical protein
MLARAGLSARATAPVADGRESPAPGKRCEHRPLQGDQCHDLDARGLSVAIDLSERGLVHAEAAADDERAESRQDDGDDHRQARRAQAGDDGHLPVRDRVGQKARRLRDRDHDDPLRVDVGEDAVQ